MVTLELSRVDARRLLMILIEDRNDYVDGIDCLKEVDPDSVVWKLCRVFRGQTPDQAIKTTEQAIETIDRVMAQLRETKKD